MRLILFVYFIACSMILVAQQKQANTSGSEIIADAPLKIKKFNNQGSLNGIPVFMYIHDSNSSSYKNDLIDIKISIKNSDTSTFESPLTFKNYTDSAFQKLISCRSVYDSYFDIQHFDSSGTTKDAETTIKFTKDTNWWISPISQVYITHTHWYFVFTIPPEKLIGYKDIIDISVEFNLDYDINETKYFRIFRYTDSLPVIENWYKGDTHFHAINTQNNVSANHIKPDGVKIYPNPAKNEIVIETQEPYEQSSLSIINATGQEITNQKIEGLKTKVNINYLSSGIYYLKTQSNKIVSTHMFVKE